MISFDDNESSSPILVLITRMDFIQLAGCTQRQPLTVMRKEREHKNQAPR